MDLPKNIKKQKGRPRGIVPWRVIMREVFWYLEHAPDKLEKRIGIKLPSNFKKRDLQMLLVYRQLKSAAKGDLKALEALMDRMDGKPNQPIEIDHDININLIEVEKLPIELRKRYIKEQAAKLKKIC
jgi:hypothetical protein